MLQNLKLEATARWAVSSPFDKAIFAMFAALLVFDAVTLSLLGVTFDVLMMGYVAWTVKV